MKCVVIGLGRFGVALARNLEKSGAEVIAIDAEIGPVEELRDDVTLAVRLDATDEEELRAHGVAGADIGIVSIGDDFESTVLTTALLKQLKVKRVVARAATELRARILRHVGADDVFSPEDEAARTVAQEIVHPNLIEYTRLSLALSVAEVKVPASQVGKTLRDMDLTNRYGVFVQAIKRIVPAADPTQEDQELIQDVPGANYTLREGDILVLSGKEEAVQKVMADWT